jgi:5'-nucleotidase
MAMGNREFHFLDAGLKSKVRLARFPILSANLHSDSIEIGPTVIPSARFNICGIMVIVFGLCVPMITKRMIASKVSPFWFSDPIETAARIVPELRDQSDVLIALTHIGLQADMELAESISGIDLIVGGHTHAVLAEPRMVGQTAVVQAGWWGHYLGKVEITLPGMMKNPEVRGSLIDLRSEAGSA